MRSRTEQPERYSFGPVFDCDLSNPPKFENGNPSPTLVLYDEGRSTFVAQLEGAQNLKLVHASSQDWMEQYFGHRDFVVLGIVLPANFDKLTGTGSLIQLEGYAIHWAPEGEVVALQNFVEGTFGELTGNRVSIDVDGNTVFTRSNSRGMAFLISAMVVLSLVMIGVSLVPNLMLEEKVSRTIESLLVSPVDERLHATGKALSGAFYCSIALAIIFLFNTALITHWWLAILVGICGSFFALSIGLLLGSTIEIRQQLMLWAWPVLILLLVPMFLSLLTDLLPRTILTLFAWVPTVALSKAFRVSFTERALFLDFGPELGLVIGAAVLLLAGVVLVIRRSDVK